jgi:hypothetical protein
VVRVVALAAPHPRRGTRNLATEVTEESKRQNHLRLPIVDCRFFSGTVSQSTIENRQCSCQLFLCVLCG